MQQIFNPLPAFPSGEFLAKQVQMYSVSFMGICKCFLGDSWKGTW